MQERVPIATFEYKRLATPQHFVAVGTNCLKLE
jgi:hypothetical protein